MTHAVEALRLLRYDLAILIWFTKKYSLKRKPRANSSKLFCHNETMIIYGTFSPKFTEWRSGRKSGKENGAYYYSKEIEDNILPEIKADVLVVTAGAALYTAIDLPDGCIVVCHDNRSTKQSYGRLFGKGIVWVCSKHSTVETLEGYGERAVYIPLSIDTQYVKQFKRKKTKDTAYVGNAWDFKRAYLNSLPANIEQLSDMPRVKLLKEMAKYKNVIAEGRTLQEAQILGCNTEVPKYDGHESVYVEALDNRETIPEWRKLLEAVQEEQSGFRIVRATIDFKDLAAKTVRREGDVFRVSKSRAKELLNNQLNIVEEL